MGKIRKLPFDLYQRYMFTKELADSVRMKNRLMILDVGGHPGVIGDFFPRDKTFLIDLKIVKRENFIKADCEFLPFKDAVFDLTVNMDVLEHIPKKKRIPTLNELLRVSKQFLIIGAPFDSEEVQRADKILLQYTKDVSGKIDDNLKEHSIYGLPNLSEIEGFFNDKKLGYQVFPNGYLHNWIIMQKLNHCISERDAYDTVNEQYNLTFYEKDNQDPSYRKILLIDKNLNNSSGLKKKTQSLRKKYSIPLTTSEIRTLELIERLVEDLTDQIEAKSHKIRLTDQHVKNLEDAIENLKDQVEAKSSKIKLTKQHIRKLEDEIANMKNQIEFKSRKAELTDQHAQNIENVIENLRTRIRSADTYARNLEEGIREIEESLAWKIINKYRRFNNRWFPCGTRRRSIVDRFAAKFYVAVGEDFDIALRDILRALLYVLRRRSFFELSLNEQYRIWLENNELPEDRLVEMRKRASVFTYRPSISLVMPVHNTKEEWLRLALDSVIRQTYSNCELCIADDASTKENIREILTEYSGKYEQIKVKYLKKNLGIAGASNEALSMARGEFIGFVDHDDELPSNALFEFVKLLNQNKDLDLIYSDEDKKELSGQRVEPFFKPDWSPDLLLSMNYISHFTIFRKTLIDRIGGFRRGFEGSQDYDLVLRFTELTNKISHIPKPLYSWRKVPGSAATSTQAKPYAKASAMKALSEALSRRGLDGEVLTGFGGHYRVRYRVHGSPLVSIIVPTKDKIELLKRCVESIESKTLYENYEIIIIDNDSADPDTISYLRTVRHRVVRFNEPFNFSKINNLGAKLANGEYLLFLNNDTEVADGNWLESMLEHSQRPEVGIVGALLLYPPGSDSRYRYTAIQHAGVILGVSGVANHAFRGLPNEASNYFGLHGVIRNCSAVTAACMMLRKNVFDEVGGFDEDFKIVFQDIDLCLRVREKGYSIVYTPYARLYHNEGATRSEHHPDEDEKYMIDRWKDTMINGDPYYNPNLTLLREDYSLAFQGSDIRPLAVLLDIYHLRPDLQRNYPEVRHGSYKRLIDWAARYGLTVDNARVPLRPYASYYMAHANGI